MLKRAEASDCAERAEALAVDLARILEVDLEPVPTAGGQLRRGKRHPHPNPSAPADISQQRTPATTQVEQASPRADPDLFGHIVVLEALRLLEGAREFAVEERTAEIGQFTEAEPDDSVGQRVGEVDVLAVRHAPQHTTFGVH